MSGKNRPDQVSMIENLVVENISELSKDDSLYQIPVQNILSLVRKSDFAQYEDGADIISRIVVGTIKAHTDNPDTILLLNELKEERLPQLTLQECVDILQSFTNLDLCVQLGEQFSLPDIDYEYLLEQKSKEAEHLQSQISFARRSYNYDYNRDLVNQKWELQNKKTDLEYELSKLQTDLRKWEH